MSTLAIGTTDFRLEIREIYEPTFSLSLSLFLHRYTHTPLLIFNGNEMLLHRVVS